MGSKAPSIFFYHPNPHIWQLHKRLMPPTGSLLSAWTTALLVFISFPSERQMKKNSFCNSISIFNIYHIWRIGQDWPGWTLWGGHSDYWAASLFCLRSVSGRAQGCWASVAFLEGCQSNRNSNLWWTDQWLASSSGKHSGAKIWKQSYDSFEEKYIQGRRKFYQ